MKGSMKRLLTVCLFAGMLGSYSVGSAYGIENYKYVFSKDDDEEESDLGMVSKAIRAIEGAIVAAAAVTAVGAGIDVYKNGYKDSKTEGFVSSAAELAKEVYFTPKNWIANKVSSKIVGNADFVETRKYLSTKDSSDATFMGEIKGLGNVIKEIGVHIWHLVNGK
jgi:hypothetical protein